MQQTITTETEHHETTRDTPSGFVRGWSGLIVVAGAIACVTPAWPLGIGAVAVGLYMAGATTVVEPVETAAMEARETTGGGCGLLAMAVGMIALFGLLGLALIAAAAEGGGM